VEPGGATPQMQLPGRLHVGIWSWSKHDHLVALHCCTVAACQQAAAFAPEVSCRGTLTCAATAVHPAAWRWWCGGRRLTSRQLRQSRVVTLQPGGSLLLCAEPTLTGCGTTAVATADHCYVLSTALSPPTPGRSHTSFKSQTTSLDPLTLESRNGVAALAHALAIVMHMGCTLHGAAPTQQHSDCSS
jgi:hypothetical protein